MIDVNTPPVGADDVVSTNEDTTVAGNVITGAPGTDTDVDGDGFPELLTLGVPISIADSVTNPIGDLTLNSDDSYLLVPAPDYNGPVPPVSYTVDD